jgi:hypothetical protein
MPISSGAGTSLGCAEECIIPSADQDGRDRDGGAKRNGVGACADRSHARQAQMRSIYPWLIERISQTFFQEWIGAHSVPTKIDHAEWLCTMCGEYTATWETRSGSYCKYCWSLGQTSPLGPVPKYMLEMIPHDSM